MYSMENQGFSKGGESPGLQILMKVGKSKRGDVERSLGTMYQGDPCVIT